MELKLPEVLSTQLPDGRQAVMIGNSINVRGVGDSLILSAVVREFNTVYPGIPISIHTKGPKEIFLNNPRVSQVIDNLIPINIDNGTGHYIQRKCRFFGIENPSLKGELFFTEKELKIARATLDLLCPKDKLPVIFIMNSSDNRRNWTVENWSRLIDLISSKYECFQIEQVIHYNRFEPNNPDNGMPCLYKTVPNARQELRNLDLRKAFALQAITQRTITSNTGFYHSGWAVGDVACFMHHQYAGDSEWVYPDAFNFWEDSNPNDIASKLIERWSS